MDRQIEEFEQLKKEVEELRIRRMTDLREKERLEAEFEALKGEIKEKYGCEISDFEGAIRELAEEFEKDMEKLRRRVAECKEMLKVE